LRHVLGGFLVRGRRRLDGELLTTLLLRALAVFLPLLLRGTADPQRTRDVVEILEYEEVAGSRDEGRLMHAIERKRPFLAPARVVFRGGEQSGVDGRGAGVGAGAAGHRELPLRALVHVFPLRGRVPRVADVQARVGHVVLR